MGSQTSVSGAVDTAVTAVLIGLVASAGGGGQAGWHHPPSRGRPQVIPSADLPKTVTASELTGSSLKYAPPANANGTGYASFKFKVNDGMVDSTAEYTVTVNVPAVNDPATGTPTISGTAQVGQTLTASTAGIAAP